ncbi:MAG: hypothetical protein L0Y68_06755 [Candidatus Dadabacteria bacterium]|nr:hypothetical protein [Candidatus Dadabacteria bacterium]
MPRPARNTNITCRGGVAPLFSSDNLGSPPVLLVGGELRLIVDFSNKFVIL